MTVSAERKRFHIVHGILARTVQDTVAIFHPETERILPLRETGPRIWELLSEEPDAERIVARLAEEYNGPEPVIREQVMQFLSQLEAEQIVQTEP